MNPDFKQTSSFDQQPQYVFEIGAIESVGGFMEEFDLKV